MSGRVGFIGLGIMGRPMAANLLAAGYEVVVANRSRPAVDELVAQGATAADTPADAGRGVDVVITMLPDSPDVAEVVGGPGGVLERVEPGTLLIDMSTISPLTARELAASAAERGCSMLDAPVSGGDVGARAGTLSIMVGGAAEDFERARPIFEVLGQTIVHVGDAGAGQVVKACNQLVVALSIQAVSEALVLGSAAGIEPALILDVLGGGLAGNKVMEVRRSNFLEHDFKPGFKVKLHHKDLGIALAAARESGVVLPGTAMVDQLMQALRRAGHGEDDHSSLLTEIERLSDQEVK
jgi:2-hydroxy-3-oxopropionate reductase